jgi:hypothetical protein
MSVKAWPQLVSALLFARALDAKTNLEITVSRIRLVVLVFSALLARTACADIVYTFTTTNPASLAGPLGGTFTVADSAIANGFIAASEIKTFSFTLASTTSPFIAATFAPPDALSIASPFASTISVDPVSGHFLADSVIGIFDSNTGQQLSVTTYPGTIFPLVPQYEIVTAVSQIAQGQGTWTVTSPQVVPAGVAVATPALDGLGCFVLAMVLAIAGYSRRKPALSTTTTEA